MNSHTTERFRKLLAALPETVRRQSREAYRLFQRDPHHPGLKFRKVHATRPIWSARINLDYRAVGLREGNTIVWYWIGSHSEYERVLARS